jgi:mRNA interferase MazF
MFDRGDVVWCEDPDDPGFGRRPVCVLTRSVVIPYLTSVIVVPATRTIRDIPTEVELDEEDGMPERCVLTLDNLTSVPTDTLGSHITSLSAARLRQVCRAVGIAVDC